MAEGIAAVSFPNIKNPTISKELKYGLLGIGGALVANAVWTKLKRNKIYADAFSNPAVAFAQRLADAMNPSGYGWMGGLDGTNETAIQQIGAEIKTLGKQKEVVDAYKNMFGSELINDLRKEGGLNAFTKGINGAGTTQTTPPANTAAGGLTGAIANIFSYFSGSGTTNSTNVNVGKEFIYKVDANIRAYSYPFDIIAKGVKGSLAGVFVDYKDIKLSINGVLQTVRFANLTFAGKRFLVDSAAIALKGTTTTTTSVKIGDSVKFTQVCSIRSTVAPYSPIGTVQAGILAGTIQSFKTLTVVSGGKNITTSFALIKNGTASFYVAAQYLKK